MSSSSRSVTCAGCLVVIKGRKYMECALCNNVYDLLCANVSEKQSRRTEDWTCDLCKVNKPRSDNTNTPVRENKTANRAENASSCPAQGPGHKDSDTASQQQASLVGGSGLSPDGNLIASIKDQIIAAVKLELPSILSSVIKVELQPVRQDMQIVKEIQQSIAFISKSQEDMQKSIDALVVENNQLRSENQELRSTITDLSERTNNMEQHLRANNIEIHGIPENRAENIHSIIKQCADVIKYNLGSDDVARCTRVAKLNKDSKVPRTVIVQFKNGTCRDGFYSAVQRYNKSHPKEKLHTGLLGYAGDRLPVYVSEHLSPQNKALHAAARKKAKEASYKFVWIRNGRIYARKDMTSQYIHIKNMFSLNLMK